MSRPLIDKNFSLASTMCLDRYLHSRRRARRASLVAFHSNELDALNNVNLFDILTLTLISCNCVHQLFSSQACFDKGRRRWHALPLTFYVFRHHYLHSPRPQMPIILLNTAERMTLSLLIYNESVGIKYRDEKLSLSMTLHAA